MPAMADITFGLRACFEQCEGGHFEIATTGCRDDSAQKSFDVEGLISPCPALLYEDIGTYIPSVSIKWTPQITEIQGGPTIGRGCVVVDCGGYQLSDVFTPAQQNDSLRHRLKGDTNPFGDLSSEKVSLYSAQLLRAFERTQIRIRSANRSPPYTLHNIICGLARRLIDLKVTTYEQLSDWYLDAFIETDRQTTFTCTFRLPDAYWRQFDQQSLDWCGMM